jgi:hypothetical protein
MKPETIFPINRRCKRKKACLNAKIRLRKKEVMEVVDWAVQVGFD